MATVLVCGAGFLLNISALEWMSVIFAVGLVWVSESLNTAIEKITDLASPEYHELARITKDTAAAAVLIASVTSAIIGLIVFLPKLFSLLI